MKMLHMNKSKMCINSVKNKKNSKYVLSIVVIVDTTKSTNQLALNGSKASEAPSIVFIRAKFAFQMPIIKINYHAFMSTVHCAVYSSIF